MWSATSRAPTRAEPLASAHDSSHLRTRRVFCRWASATCRSTLRQATPHTDVHGPGRTPGGAESRRGRTRAASAALPRLDVTNHQSARLARPHHAVAGVAGALEAQAGVAIARLVRCAARDVTRARRALPVR